MIGHPHIISTFAEKINMEQSDEILLNAVQVTNNDFSSTFEFVIDSALIITDCVEIDPIDIGSINHIGNAAEELEGLLFELNHVRVNPRINNELIINNLTTALNDIGVDVENKPNEDSMAICFKPLGEICTNVRFYVNNKNKLILLSPNLKPKLACIQGGKYSNS